VPQIEEGRVTFRQRTEPRLHVIYEDQLVLLDACAKKEVVHERWLFDVASARSVGRRWAFLAAQVGPSRRSAVVAEGTRWLTDPPDLADHEV